MRIRRLRGQSVAEFLLSFIWLWALFMLVLAVCTMWASRIVATHYAIEGVCREAVSSGSGASFFNENFQSMFPGQDVLSSAVTTGGDKYIHSQVSFTAAGSYSAPFLIFINGGQMSNESAVKTVLSCPKQYFLKRP